MTFLRYIASPYTIPKRKKRSYLIIKVDDSYPITEALHWLTHADVIVGHNIIGYDLPVLRKTYSWFEPCNNVIDTLVLSRLYHPNMMEIDKKET